MPVKVDPAKVKVVSDQESSIDENLLFQQYLADIEASRKLQCCYCYYSTRRKMDLEVHIAKQHKTIDVKSVTFTCNYCNYTSKRRADLKSHMWRHNTSAVKCKCDKCSFTTKKKYLKDRLSVHQVNKTYHCPHCDWTGTWYGSLRQHLTRHSSNL